MNTDATARPDAPGEAGGAQPGYARVALDVPIAPFFDYRIPVGLHGAIAPGDWVVVPWGRGRKVGIVLALAASSEIDDDRVRDLGDRLDDAPLAPAAWLELARFAARYYHRHPGEVLLPAIPKLLRAVPRAGTRSRGSAFERARRRFPAAAGEGAAAAGELADAPATPVLNAAQARALEALRGATGFAAFVLHGVTGSGKTEVYLRFLADRLARDPAAQVLLLVPEIALTPQLADRVRRRFPHESLAILHSGLPEGERAANWLAVADGRARILVGTRLAILAPMPGLAGIVVDEEHDPSYRQQEGVHYSARDLAVMLAHQHGIPVVLGSATPALETWHGVGTGRYELLSLPERASGAPLPRVRIIEVGRELPPDGLSEVARTAIAEVLGSGGQAMVFLNRRGYAPVLACGQCGWLSRCDACSAYRVLHRRRGVAPDARFRLVCHHCGAEQAVPRACPACGDVDLHALGRGTQRLEEALADSFPEARIARLDRDVARRRGAAEALLDAVHAGSVDLLVGTQMLAKGHDFQRLRLVVVADPDSALFAADFRAPERLFATLMQVAGRAGRFAHDGEVLVQTRFPGEALFGALAAHDFAGFAEQLLAERRAAGLPPFAHQALLRAEAGDAQAALGFLARARDALYRLQAALPPGQAAVRCFDPVPMPMARLAGRERAQLLVEADARPALHRALAAWLPELAALDSPVRWQLEVDPAEI